MRSTKPVLIVVRRDHDEVLDRIKERTGKTRSKIVQDALDRYFTVIPDAEIPAHIYRRK